MTNLIWTNRVSTYRGYTIGIYDDELTPAKEGEEVSFFLISKDMVDLDSGFGFIGPCPVLSGLEESAKKTIDSYIESV